jgi:hypothetical protein
VGTNYYALADATCDNPDHTERLHIGKLSMGWKPGLHGYPDRGLVSWARWREFLQQGRVVEDEYGEKWRGEDIVVRFEEHLARALANPQHGCRIDPARQGQRPWAPDPEREFHDAEGWDIYCGEFS